MKINLLLISLFFLVSCKEIQKKRWCEEGIVQAEKEIEEGGLVYSKYSRIGRGYPDRYHKELKQLLNEKEIQLQYKGGGCISHERYDEIRNCYEETMLNEIKNKFGKEFIESIENQADEIFANKEDYIFEDFELDERPYFNNPKGKDYSRKDLVKYLNKYLKYPDYDELAKTIDERPYLQLSFIVDKNGKPKDFTIMSTNFPKEKTKIKKHYEIKDLQIISQLPKWESGVIHGKKVDTKFTKNIPLDWIKIKNKVE